MRFRAMLFGSLPRRAGRGAVRATGRSARQSVAIARVQGFLDNALFNSLPPAAAPGLDQPQALFLATMPPVVPGQARPRPPSRGRAPAAGRGLVRLRAASC